MGLASPSIECGNNMTGEKQGKAMFITVSTVLLLGFFLFALSFNFFGFLENPLIDLRFTLFNRELPVSGDIVFIAVDDDSLAAMAQSIGDWPWPRGKYIAHHVVDYVMTGQPAVFLFDMSFFGLATKSEEETISEQDKELIAASMNYGAEGKLGHAMIFTGGDGQAPRELPPASEGNFRIAVDDSRSNVRFPVYPGYTLPFPDLNSGSAMIHSVTRIQDGDGIDRAYPLLIDYHGKYYPSLALRALESRLKLSRYRIEDRTLIADREDGKPFRVPLTGRGGYRLDFYPGNGKFTVYHAADIIGSARLYEAKEMDNLKVRPEAFRDKIVVFGMTAAGSKNVAATPMGRDFPEPFIHLTAVSNILLGQDLAEAPLPAGIAVLAGCALIVLALNLFLENRLLRVILPVLVAAGFTLTAFLLFRWAGILIDMSSAVLFLLAGALLPLFHTSAGKGNTVHTVA
jgi:adenylate cyclase